MTKTKRMIIENLSLIDVVIEILDARIPFSSKNPDIDILAKDKKRIIVLNKADLADENSNKIWIKYFEEKGFKVVLANSITGKGLNNIWIAASDLMKEKIDRLKSRGRIFVPIRAMILGIPNSGKSTLINKIVGKGIAETGDRPGVTRNKQWIKIRKEFELLDTPGILWPKFEDENVALNLAFTGAIKDDVIDMQTLAVKFIEKIRKLRPEALNERYKLDYDVQAESHKVLELIGEKRGFKVKGGKIDLEKASVVILDEFREGKLGNITLELPEISV